MPADKPELKNRINRGLKYVDENSLRDKLKDLEKKSQAEDAWQDENIFRELKSTKSQIETWDNLEAEYELYELENPSEKDWLELENRIKQAETTQSFTGENDACPAIISIYAGAGGDDAQDFAEMLMKMYLSTAENKNWQAKILEKTDGEIAGIRSATIEIAGEYAYGWLRGEHGVHRLVRLSPFNSGNTRETSFAKIEVIPKISKEKLKIDEKDLRIDVYRASGKGGQSVNTTDSAVRITHIPTSTVATCQTERSQLQNKNKALEVLTGRLAKMLENQNQENLESLKGEKQEIAFGSQIRSYTLHPYKLIKDHRTGIETKNPDKVFAGNMEDFLQGNLTLLNG